MTMLLSLAKVGCADSTELAAGRGVREDMVRCCGGVMLSVREEDRSCEIQVDGYFGSQTDCAAG